MCDLYIALTNHKKKSYVIVIHRNDINIFTNNTPVPGLLNLKTFFSTYPQVLMLKRILYKN